MSQRWIADIESNGLLDTINTVWCIVLRCPDTDEVRQFKPHQIEEALDLLSTAAEVIGHNFVLYDYPALQIVYPDFEIKGTITDTLILSKMIHNELYNDDVERNWSVTPSASSAEKFPKKFWGRHSLKAWGMRLGDFKDDYDGGWDAYSDVMLSYCVQDTQVTAALYKSLMKTEPSEQAIYLEHRMASICHEIGQNGWTFDEKAAGKLYAELAQKRHVIEEDLKDLFPAWEVTEDFYPRRGNKTLGYKAGELFVKSKTVYFNPSSNPHIERCLVEKYKHKFKEFTPNGQAKIDHEVLSKLPYPEAQRLATFKLIQKRIGMLAEGNGAWLKKVDADGRIRHRIDPLATTSTRAAHSSPNLGQVPSARSPYGKECRSLFGVPEGWVLCGADLSGIELRALASYLAPYDGGEYAKQILEGDIHTYNAKAFGTDRPTAKVLIYSINYGGGDMRVGEIAGGGRAKGKQLKEQFFKSVPAFATLMANLGKAYARGYIKTCDGRKLKVRSDHRCLSQLLQSCGSLVSKWWVLLTYDEIKKQHGDDAYIVGWIHDEIQVACKNEEIAENVGNIARRMAEEAGRTLKLKIGIAAEHSVGRTWLETH